MVLMRNVFTVGVGTQYDFDVLLGFATHFKVENGNLRLISTKKEFKTTVHIHNPDEWYVWLENQPYTVTNYDVIFEVKEGGLRIVVSNYDVNYSCCSLL